MMRDAPAASGARIDALIGALDASDNPRAADPGRELVRAVLEMHGAGLSRAIDIAAAAGGPGRALIEALAIDPAVRPLLLLYGLHPHDIATRAARAVDRLRGALGARSIAIELVAADETRVRVKLAARAKGPRQAPAQLREEIESAVQDEVPEVATVEIEGLPDPNVSELRFIPRPASAAQPSPAGAPAPRAV